MQHTETLIKYFMIRPNYSQTDKLEREAQIGDRNNTADKLNVTELWMKVLHKAVDDIATYSLKQEREELTKEEEFDLANAYGILFDPDWRIHIDDYFVNVHCPKCETLWPMKMSIVASEDVTCPKCKRKTKPKTTLFTKADQYVTREISLEDLLAIWGLEDVIGFRDGIKNQIRVLKMKKREIRKKKEESKMRKEGTEDPAAGREFVESFRDRNASPGNEDGHYSGPIQPTDFCLAQGLGILEHAIIKYICRYRRKHGVLDLEKAGWYLMKLIEEYEAELKAQEKQ
jgi:hypothetical protein